MLTCPGSLWLVKGAHAKPCTQGTPLKDGDVIRLEHVNTQKYLHSHYHQSPLSGQQEVSSYLGNDGRGDTGAPPAVSLCTSRRLTPVDHRR